MPLVHWLPKNALRLAIIHFFARIGMESKWDEMRGRTLEERVEAYYKYSVEKTFYRSNGAIASIFKAHGLEADFCTIDNPKLDQFALVRWARSRRIARYVLNLILIAFISGELSTRKARV